MAAMAIRSTVDVEFWLQNRAQSAGERLAPQKLQRLLYLSQAQYAALNQGSKLMPATFVVTEYGPLEPTIYHVFESGPPQLKALAPSARVEAFLLIIWQRFGTHTAEELFEIIKSDGVYNATLEEHGRNAELPIEALAAAYQSRAISPAPVAGTGVSLEDLDRRAQEHELKSKGLSPKPKKGEKEYWTQDGRRGSKWVPGQKRG
jgi:uncharacterized phage-associated protein